MSRIVFLDIDGVLLPFGRKDFSPLAVAAVKAMLDGSTAIVMSSTWRHVPELRHEAEAKLWECDIPIVGWIDADIPGKGTAIAEYLFSEYGAEVDWPEVVIVDDQAGPEWLAGATIITPDGKVGLVDL